MKPVDPKRVACPTCGAAPKQPCTFTDLPQGWGPSHNSRIGAAEASVYGSPDAAALAAVRGPSDQSLPPEQDPAHYRADRPSTRPGSAHDAYEEGQDNE